MAKTKLFEAWSFRLQQPAPFDDPKYAGSKSMGFSQYNTSSTAQKSTLHAPTMRALLAYAKLVSATENGQSVDGLGLRPACYLDSDLLISVEDDEATDDVTPEHAGEIIAALAEQFGGTFATEDQLTTALSFMLGTLRATREKEARHEYPLHPVRPLQGPHRV